MSLVFAALTPHPPLLIPSIGKEVIKKIEKTKRALEKLEEDLYLSRPELLVVISPHGHLLPDAFTINVHPEFETNLIEFGDLTTRLTFTGEMDLASVIREESKKENFPTVLLSEKSLDHGVTVPLFYLTPHLKGVNILPIGFCGLDHKTHLDFGYFLKERIMNSSKRVAVIASGDMSHALTTDAPAGFNPAGKIFDEKIQELLTTHNTTGFLQFDPKIIEAAAACGFRPLLILMGLLRGINFEYKFYNYEAPFGVGYLTANFAL